MCDYSLHSVATRKARVGDKLVTTNFGTGTIGMASIEDRATAVCMLPGTEVAFDGPVLVRGCDKALAAVAQFAHLNEDIPNAHHDALRFPDGTVVLLALLQTGQAASVLQLPAEPRAEVLPAPVEAPDEHERV